MNFLPAEKAGTVLAAILISLPVCGFLPVLAALLRASKVPKPTNVTLSPFFTAFSIVSIVAANTDAASFLETLADLEISIGDYILTGGEIAAMAIIDSTVRLLDGVINEESHTFDSFEDGLLDYPVYTHPACFEGMKVPDVLLSGHHENIKKWRYEQQVLRTKQRRPDLLEKRD